MVYAHLPGMISRSKVCPAAKSDGVATAEFILSLNNCSLKELDSAFFFFSMIANYVVYI